MQSVSPQYEAEEKITVNGNVDLYAVVFLLTVHFAFAVAFSEFFLLDHP